MPRNISVSDVKPCLWTHRGEVEGVPSCSSNPNSPTPQTSTSTTPLFKSSIVCRTIFFHSDDSADFIRVTLLSNPCWSSFMTRSVRELVSSSWSNTAPCWVCVVRRWHHSVGSIKNCLKIFLKIFDEEESKSLTCGGFCWATIRSRSVVKSYSS